jgi:hypothetical protein
MTKSDLQLLALEMVRTMSARGGVSAYELRDGGVKADLKSIKQALRELSSRCLVHWNTKTGRYVTPCVLCGGGL